MARRYYRLKIWPRGAVSTTGTASYDLASSYFRDAPVAGGQIVRAAECLVESNPWRVTLVDEGSTFTAKLANSSGRMHLLGRLCQLQTALDSTASFSPIGTGRLTDVALNGDVASWDIDISDERWVERQLDIFPVCNTVAIVPYGPIAAWQHIAGIQMGRWRAVAITGNLVCLRFDGPSQIPKHPDIAQLIVNDVAPTAITGNSNISAGNFTTLRFRNSGNATDYQVAAFGFSPFFPGRAPNYPSDSILGFWNDPVALANAQAITENPWLKLYMWVVWPTSQPTLNTDVKGYLYAPTHEPTELLPQLIGGTTGLHPGRFVRNAYSGTYSATTSITVRKSTVAFDAWENEAAYGRVWVRATAPANMATFLDERFYGPYSIAPVTDSSGKIAPTPMWIPTSTQINVSGLATLTSTNLLGHPTFEHPSREAVTALRYTHEMYYWPLGPTGLLQHATTQGSTRIHDTVTSLGKRLLTFKLCSVTYPIERVVSTGVPTVPIGAVGLFDRLAQGIFQRFGDGPIYSNVECTSAIDGSTNGAILPGDFVKLNLATFPNPLTLARTGIRVMQVLRRDITPLGRRFVLLDAGSTLASLSAPTVTMALSTQSSRHAVVTTVASVTTGARYELHLARTTSTGSTRPQNSSPRWYPAAALRSSTHLVITHGQQPSKTRIYARVRQAKPGRIASPWSTASVSVVTASIAAPTSFSVTSLTAQSGVAKWTNGSSLYGVEVMVDATSSASLASSNVVAQVPPQTTRFALFGLNSNDTHKGGVRHFDPFGGRSAQATNTFTTTTGSASAAPSLRGLVVVVGAA